MKRYLCYLATMLLVFSITDFCLGGSLFKLQEQVPDNISASLNSVKKDGKQLREPWDTEGLETEKLGELIASESCEFVRAAFSRDKAQISDMLSEEAEYMVSEDKSSYIRYTAEDLHVEGYMATDRKLVLVRHCWHVMEDDGTITSAVEVGIDGEKTCQTWYIHYRKSFGQWKIFMLENGI